MQKWFEGKRAIEDENMNSTNLDSNLTFLKYDIMYDSECDMLL